MVHNLFADEVLDGNLELLFLGVAGELEHLHAVAQRRRHGIEHVRGRQKEDFERSNGTSR